MIRSNVRQAWVVLLLALPTPLLAQVVDLRMDTGADSYFSPMASTFMQYGPPLIRFIYVIVGLLGISKGFHIYRRMNAGEDGIAQSVAQWAGGLLMVICLTYALDVYLETMAQSVGYQRIMTP